MATRNRLATSPMTFDLPVSLVSRIEACRRRNMLRNASEVIRLAIDQCDFDAYRPNHDSHRQVSVRIGVRQRAMLKRFARAKRSSVGELLRIALEELLSKTAPKKARR